MYQLTQSDSILRLADCAYIPNDTDNADYAAYLHWLGEGNTPEPAPEPVRDLYAEWKLERESKVAAITVEVDGLLFDGDETSQNRMARVVIAANDPADTTYWALHDNRVELVTAAQLKAACRLAGEEQTRIWNEGRPA